MPLVRVASVPEAPGLIFMAILAIALGPVAVHGQAAGKNPPPPQPGARLSEADRKAAEALAAPADKPAEPAPPAAAAPMPSLLESENLLELWFVKGGVLMYPITLMSFLVVVFAVERLLGLRRRKVIPRGLVEGLGQLAGKPGGLDPRAAYHLCQQYPSTAASVIRAVLLKVGRPHSEVEHTLTDACEREAGKLYKNVRTINLAVSVTPLLGLLGTVQGMILSFFTTANLGVGADKSQALANGIYIALITTFGGLVVAIPAKLLAHWFEGLIQARFREIDELMMNLLPQLERYEGKLRLTARSGPAPAASEPPDQTPRPKVEAAH